MVDKYVGIITNKPVELTKILDKHSIPNECVYKDRESDGDSIYITLSRIPKNLRDKLKPFVSKYTTVVNNKSYSESNDFLVKRKNYLETEDYLKLEDFIINAEAITAHNDFVTDDIIHLLGEFTSTKGFDESVKRGNGAEYLKEKFTNYIKHAKLQNSSGV